MTPDAPKKRGRPRGSGFKPGVSGNPSGRRANEESRAAKLRQAIGAEMPQLIEVVMRQALGGDMQAARMLVDRCIAPLKPRESPALFALPNGSLTEQAAAAVRAIADGSLSAGQGLQIVGAINSLAGLREADENVRAIEEIRGQLAQLKTTA